MSTEIAEMRVALSVKKEKVFRLKKKWESLAEAVRRGINLELSDIVNVRMDELDIVWDQMKNIWAETLALRSDIERLERKLG